MIAGLWLDNTAAYTFLRGSTIVWCTIVVTYSESAKVGENSLLVYLVCILS
jgi:hypothetical protein